jgi:hypothetical protein
VGINRYILGYLDNHFKDKYQGLRMLELGDQKIHPEIIVGSKCERLWAKDYFEEMGIHHYSIDWNGSHGAYPLDLSKPITDRFWFNRFDVVTNFGTVEHVEGQYECWRNIHNFTKIDGLMIHALPFIWPNHCNYYYGKNFVVNLAAYNKYEVLDCRIIKTTISYPKNEKVFMYMLTIKKKIKDFMTDKNLFESWITNGNK